MANSMAGKMLVTLVTCLLVVVRESFRRPRPS